MKIKKQSKQNKGRKFENVAQKTIASGSIWFDPLDIKSDEFCIEVKYTEKKGFRITKDLLNKIWGQALSMNKEPALIIGIKRNDEQVFILHCRINLERKL